MSTLRVARVTSALLLVSAGAAFAQRGYDRTNPTSSTALRLARGAARQLTQAAEDMPAEKYGFKPTPAQWSFGEVVAHVTDENDQTCDPLLGRAQHHKEPAATEAKATLVAALRASFARCDTAFAAVNDAKLTDQVSYYGSNSPVVSLLFGAVFDWSDHYAQEAIYLRLNGILPPTARRGN